MEIKTQKVSCYDLSILNFDEPGAVPAIAITMRESRWYDYSISCIFNHKLTIYMGESNEILSKEWQKKGHVIIFSQKWAFGAKIEINGPKWVKKTPIYIFSTVGSKINKFELKKFQNLKVVGNYPNI